MARRDDRGVYHGALVDDRTMDVARDPTPIFGFMAVGQVPPGREPTAAETAVRNLRNSLIVAGVLFFVLVVCGLGGFLFVQAFCPCTVGDSPAVPAANSVVLNTTGPYDSTACTTAEETSR